MLLDVIMAYVAPQVVIVAEGLKLQSFVQNEDGDGIMEKEVSVCVCTYKNKQTHNKHARTSVHVGSERGGS